MNTANNVSEIRSDEHASSRPMSVLQFATALAFVALPATVLFPIIAKPEQPNPVVVANITQPAQLPKAHIGHLNTWSADKVKAETRSKVRIAMLDITNFEPTRQH